ncbi:hypothetical protein OROGR_023448 [Orobanche gracilis]
MSILPSRNPDSTSLSSSSHSPSHSPASNHGLLSSNQSHQKLQISDSPPPAHAYQLSEQVAPAAQDSGGSSKEVKGKETPSNGKIPIHQNGGKTLHSDQSGHAQIRSLEWRGKPSRIFVSPSSLQSAASSGFQTSSAHSTGKKVQMFNGNHLLNFRYDPISVSRPQPRAPPPRRYQKRRPYNKDLFFQANYKFVVLDSGNYAAESMDPDKMLCWEDIICLNYSTPFPVNCPICLDDPLCPQITSCGHIFCFPCILQYFSIGEIDIQDECWKKCPLCFTMISSRDLHTIYIENVKQYHVGDEVELVLLTRQKGSFSSALKNNERINVEEEILELDSFSKFTLISDVELSVREAMSDLDSWIARANSGQVDGIEKLPYVCAAIEQLERRKKYWNEHRASIGDNENMSFNGSPPTAKSDNSDWYEKSSPEQVVAELCSPQVAEFNDMLEDHERCSSSSVSDNKDLHSASVGTKERSDGGSYNFYQAIDGQHLILHPLSMKCLLHHYGNYENLPNSIENFWKDLTVGDIDTIRGHETALSLPKPFFPHNNISDSFPKGIEPRSSTKRRTGFQLCEIDLSDKLPVESLSPFMDEIKNREKQRKQLARKEHKEKIKAEAAGSQFLAVPCYSIDPSPSFSVDDFEALGSSIAVSSSSSSSSIGEMQSYSSVARLGFAAAHDSPSLKTDDVSANDMPPHETGWRETGTSFADITSRTKQVEVMSGMPKANEAAGKKGKKPTRILMSTAGGRRY